MDLKKWLQFYRHTRAGGWAGGQRFLSEYQSNFVTVLSAEPPVVYMWWGRDDEVLHQALRDKPLMVLYLFPWCFDRNELPQVQSYVARILSSHPRHRIIFLCNEEYGVEELRALGIEAEFIHQNAFIDERVFGPRPSVERTHDAVYSASMSPYKRHLLASKVSSLIMLGYTYKGTSTDEYAKEVRAGLKHAWWAKDTQHGEQKLSTEAIVSIYARAHVGLCLSAIEGGMFVSMEYLLCGLPIVTTRSIGGRDAFWDDRYVTVVEDESPEAIAAAVADLKARSIAPDTVRQSTLSKVETHRGRLRHLLSSVGAKLECPWEPGSHGISSFRPLKAVAAEIKKAGRGGEAA